MKPLMIVLLSVALTGCFGSGVKEPPVVERIVEVECKIPQRFLEIPEGIELPEHEITSQKEAAIILGRLYSRAEDLETQIISIREFLAKEQAKTAPESDQ